MHPPLSLNMRRLDPEEFLINLVHELRQPLSAMEMSLCCLELSLDHPSGQTGDYLRLMARQVSRTDAILDQAIAELRHALAQCAATEPSLDFTNSETAVVT